MSSSFPAAAGSSQISNKSPKKDMDLTRLHKKLESQFSLKDHHQTLEFPMEKESNRLLSSHLSVFQTLENSELNNISLSANKSSHNQISLNDNNDPSFSVTSWQSIGNSVQMSKQNSNAENSNADDSNSHSRSVNSILSMSSDNEEKVDKLSSTEGTGRRSIRISTLLGKARNININDLEFNKPLGDDYDSDESGTFEVDINALIKRDELPLSSLSPSFIMPKMMVSQNYSIQNYAKICIIGNGLHKFRKELNNLNKKNNDPIYSNFQYVFTNLNSKIDLILLIFDSINGLYSKDLFNIIASFKIPVLPIIYQDSSTKSIGKSKIVVGGISDGDDSDFESNEIFDINDSTLTSLLLNNGIQIFNSPIKINSKEALTFESLHQILSSHFISKFETAFNDDDDDDDDNDDEEDELVQSSTSTWASTIIQNRRSSSDSQRRMSSQINNRSNIYNNPQKKLSSSRSLSYSRDRKNRLDKKRLSNSKINNSDPLNLNDKKSLVFNSLTIGVGLGLVTIAGILLYFKGRSNKKNLAESLAKEYSKNNEIKRFWQRPGFKKLIYNQSTTEGLYVANQNYIDNANSIDFDTSSITDSVIDCSKGLIYHTKMLIFQSMSFLKNFLLIV